MLTLVLAHLSSCYSVSKRTKSRLQARQELLLASHELARDIYYGYSCFVNQHKQHGQRLSIMHKKSTSSWYCKKNNLMRAVNKQGVQSVNLVARGCKRVQFVLDPRKLVVYTLESSHEHGHEYEHGIRGYAVCSNGVRL
jgi:hypothetical protein